MSDLMALGPALSQLVPGTPEKLRFCDDSCRCMFHRVRDGTLIKATTWSWGAYVDLYYLRGMNGGDFSSAFSGPGDGLLGLLAVSGHAAVYDTWSTHYETEGVDPGGSPGAASRERSPRRDSARMRP